MEGVSIAQSTAKGSPPRGLYSERNEQSNGVREKTQETKRTTKETKTMRLSRKSLLFVFVFAQHITDADVNTNPQRASASDPQQTSQHMTRSQRQGLPCIIQPSLLSRPSTLLNRIGALSVTNCGATVPTSLMPFSGAITLLSRLSQVYYSPLLCVERPMCVCVWGCFFFFFLDIRHCLCF